METIIECTDREKAVLAVLEKYCLPKEGRADAKTCLGWIAGVFAQNEDVYANDALGREAAREMLMRTCDPKGAYDGVTAWEISGKIIEALWPGERGFASLPFSALLAAVGFGALLAWLLAGVLL